MPGFARRGRRVLPGGALIRQPDPHIYTRLSREERVGGAAAADRDRDVLVRVLVEDDFAVARIRERPRGDRVVPLRRDLELDLGARNDLERLEILARQVELHVPEAVDVEDRSTEIGRAHV